MKKCVKCGKLGQGFYKYCKFCWDAKKLKWQVPLGGQKGLCLACRTPTSGLKAELEEVREELAQVTAERDHHDAERQETERIFLEREATIAALTKERDEECGFKDRFRRELSAALASNAELKETFAKTWGNWLNACADNATLELAARCLQNGFEGLVSTQWIVLSRERDEALAAIAKLRSTDK